MIFGFIGKLIVAILIIIVIFVAFIIIKVLLELFFETKFGEITAATLFFSFLILLISLIMMVLP